jgi:hypothetical protein
MLTRLASAAALVCLFLSVTPAVGAHEPRQTENLGVRGRATSSPSCPAERPNDPDCDPRPLEGARVVVKDSYGDVVARTVTDADGWYRIPLQPGRYTVKGRRMGDSRYPMPPPPKDFTVRSTDERFHRVDLDYDSGIR